MIKNFDVIIIGAGASGAAAAWKHDKHIHLDLVYNFFPRKIKLISDWIKNIILGLFFLFVLYLSIQFTITAYNKPTAILRIPFSYVDLPVVIFFVSVIIRSIQKILK